MNMRNYSVTGTIIGQCFAYKGGVQRRCSRVPLEASSVVGRERRSRADRGFHFDQAYPRDLSRNFMVAKGKCRAGCFGLA